MTLRVLMVGCYGAEYSRGKLVKAGLLQNGCEVVSAVHKGWLRFLKITAALLKKDFDIIIVTGKPPLALCWLLKWWHRKPIVFDVFISDYDTLVIDRQLVKSSSIKASLLWWGDRLGCRMADHIIHDTSEHITYFVDEFKLPRGKFEELLIGADEELLKPGNDEHEGFLVWFHGSYIPLQGIDTILRTAKMLESHHDIVIEMVGKGQTWDAMQALAKELDLKNVRFRDNMPMAVLGAEMRRADVCLGIFGTTPKAARVIPNKAYETIAMRKPLITEDSPAARKLFVSGKNALLCKAGDPNALANAILTLRRDPALRQRIAHEGRNTFEAQCSTALIGKRLALLLNGWRR